MMSKLVKIIFVIVLLILSATKTQAEFFSPERYYTNSLSDKLVRHFEPVDELEIPILLYHYVENVTDPRDKIRKLLSTEPLILDSQIRTLKEDGYSFISFADLKSYFRGEKYLPAKSVILTFDDGYEDFYTDVMPILQKYNVHATEYIISGDIGKPNYMSIEQIKKILKSGLVEIGAHTVNHYNLSLLPDDLAEEEIIKSREILAKTFGVDIETFAYPYGAYNSSTKRIVKESGFGTAVTTKDGFVINRNDLYGLFRIHPGIKTGTLLLNALHY